MAVNGNGKASGAPLTAGEQELRIELVAYLQFQEFADVAPDRILNIAPNRMWAQAAIQFRHQWQNSIEATIEGFAGGTSCRIVQRLGGGLRLSGATSALLCGSKTLLGAGFFLFGAFEFGVQSKSFENAHIALRHIQFLTKLSRARVDLLQSL